MPIVVDATMHLNSAAVKKMVNSKTRRALARAGGYTRSIAKRSIKKANSASAPGQPPRSHRGLLKNFIFYNYDPSTKSVIVGPEKVVRPGLTAGTPKTLEYGGTAPGEDHRPPKLGETGVIKIIKRENKWTDTRRNRRGAYGSTICRFGKTYTVRYALLRTDAMVRMATLNEKEIFGDGRTGSIAARPYMRPAFGETLKKLSDFFS